MSEYYDLTASDTQPDSRPKCAGCKQELYGRDFPTTCERCDVEDLTEAEKLYCQECAVELSDIRLCKRHAAQENTYSRVSRNMDRYGLGEHWAQVLLERQIDEAAR